MGHDPATFSRGPIEEQVLGVFGRISSVSGEISFIRFALFSIGGIVHSQSLPQLSGMACGDY